MSTVRSDKHGLYVRAGGYIFRPQRSRTTAHGVLVPGVQPAGQDAPGRFGDGQKVRAAHVGGTPTGRVGNEIWFSHGMSPRWVGGREDEGGHSKQNSSESAWDPAAH